MIIFAQTWPEILSVVQAIVSLLFFTAAYFFFEKADKRYVQKDLCELHHKELLRSDAVYRVEIRAFIEETHKDIKELLQRTAGERLL